MSQQEAPQGQVQRAVGELSKNVLIPKDHRKLSLQFIVCKLQRIMVPSYTFFFKFRHSFIASEGSFLITNTHKDSRQSWCENETLW